MKAMLIRRLLPLVTALSLSALTTGCGSSPSGGLAYQHVQGDSYRYQYYESLSTRAPTMDGPTTSLEVTYDVTMTVAEAGSREIRLDLTVDNARALVSEGKGDLAWRSSSQQTATLYLRPRTGEVIRSSGQIRLELPGSSLDVLQSIRQSLHQYPNKSPVAGTGWISPVHLAIAREVGLSDHFQATVTYTGDDVRLRQEVARLVISGTGDLRDGSGRLTIHTNALVNRVNGMPVEEETQLRLESTAIVIEGRSSLRSLTR